MRAAMKNISVFCLAVTILFLCLEKTKSEDKEVHSSNETNKATCAGKVVSLAIETVAPPKLPLDKNICHFITVVVVMVSILSNALIIHVVRVNQFMRTTTNYLIVNMACGDLCATFSTCAVLTQHIEKGHSFTVTGVFGEFLCKFQYGLYFVAMLCSVFSFVAITADRFLAVTLPLKYKVHSSRTKFIIPVIWLGSFAVPANLIYHKIILCEWPQLGKTYCYLLKSKFNAILFVCIGYVLPHVAMVILYMVIAYKLWTRRVLGEHAQRETAGHRTAKKVTRMILCILVAFDISWGPIFLDTVFPFMYDESNFHTITLKIYTYNMLMISNGTFNALIYAIFNENFRRAFQNVLICKLLVSALRKVQNVFKAHEVNEERTAQRTTENLGHSPTTGSPMVLQRI